MFRAKLMNLAHVLGAISIAYSAFSCPPATAAPIIPSSLPPGSTYHLIFATRDLGQGNFGNGPGIFGSIPYGTAGGVGNADTIVNTAGNAPTALTMGSIYRAIISDSGNNAIGLTTFLGGGTSPIYNTQGQLVAPNYASMFQGASTALTNAIRFDEYGSVTNLGAWTGTNATGTHLLSNTNWTGVGNATVGTQNNVSSLWVNANTNFSLQALRLYGISQQLTVPVPEPTAMGLLALGAVYGSHTFRRRSQRHFVFSRKFLTLLHHPNADRVLR